MRRPLVPEEAYVWVEIPECTRIRRSRHLRAVFWIRSVSVLGPKTMEHKSEVARALRTSGVRGAELGGPGKVEQVKVEARFSSSLRPGGTIVVIAREVPRCGATAGSPRISRLRRALGRPRRRRATCEQKGTGSDEKKVDPSRATTPRLVGAVRTWKGRGDQNV